MFSERFSIKAYPEVSVIAFVSKKVETNINVLEENFSISQLFFKTFCFQCKTFQSSLTQRLNLKSFFLIPNLWYLNLILNASCSLTYFVGLIKTTLMKKKKTFLVTVIIFVAKFSQAHEMKNKKVSFIQGQKNTWRMGC